MKKLTISMLLLLTISQWVFSLDVPKMEGRINDYAGIITPSERQQLENLLAVTEEKTSSQVVLLTIPSLQGEIIEDYSIKVVESKDWKLGQKGLDNGVLLLVALKERKLRIEVGYGLESILTDAKCDYIIRKLIVGHFKNGNYFAGIHSGLQSITGIINKDFDISPEQLAKFQKEKGKSKGAHIPAGFIIFIIIMILSSFKKNTRGGGGFRSGAPWVFMGGGSGRSSGGFGGGFSGGGGGFSGGGGGFGGGGSSGGW